MTKKVFWINPYQTTLKTSISSVNQQEITVDETIFFAFSGGQESDFGTFNDYPVLEARKEGKEIIYTLEKGHQLKVGDEIVMSIDWPRRYRLMKLHFAAEIVLELATRHFDHIEKIGAHISADKSRIDFVWPENISSKLVEIEQEANALILANRQIVSAFDDEENERRYWAIEGFAKVSCGGTHLKSTQEIGEIQLKRVNLGKQKERIEITLKEGNEVS